MKIKNANKVKRSMDDRILGARISSDICSECDNSISEWSMICECASGPFCSSCWSAHKAICRLAEDMDE